jgi:hypothetical protein
VSANIFSGFPVIFGLHQFSWGGAAGYHTYLLKKHLNKMELNNDLGI